MHPGDSCAAFGALAITCKERKWLKSVTKCSYWA
jgi:hypothetical protein